jgi:peptidoglycan/xylan/chitin deacetylase (PgdA/CDA1 family)
MKHGLILVIAAAIFFVFLPTGLSAADGNVVVLLYHDLKKDKLCETDNFRYCTTDIKFGKDLVDLTEMGYRSLSLADYYGGNYDAGYDYFVITFDDGYLSNYTLAFPILKKLGIHADVFICTDLCDRLNHFSWRQGQMMEDSGIITLYSHTPKHNLLSETGLFSFKYKALSSYKMLGKKLAGDRLFMFAYPGGEYTRESVEALRKSGAVMQFVQSTPDAECGWDYAASGLIRRYNVEYGTDIKQLIYNINNNKI